MNKTITLSFLAAVVVLCAIPVQSAHAQRNAFGIRGGATEDRDSVFFGVHGAIHLSGARQLRIEPSFEFGVGGSLDFSLRGNLNFKYMVPLSRNAAVYPLFGPSVYHVELDNGGDFTDVGLNIGGGFGISGLLFDLAFGISDIPDFTFTIGYTFW